MTIAITAAHNTARLAGSLTYLDSGSGNATVQVYGGARPPTPELPPDNPPLVEIPLGNPAGLLAGGQLVLQPMDDGLIMVSGVATWARILTASGEVAMDADCGPVDSGATVELSATQLYAGGAVRLMSAVLG